MLHLLVKISQKMDFLMITTFGNVSFLVLCHFWTNLSAGVFASRWNVDHLFRCVRPCHNVVWLLQWCIQVSLNNCSEKFVALFRKKIFGKISLQSRYIHHVYMFRFYICTLYENCIYNELECTVNIGLYGNPTIHIFSYLCCHSRLIYLQQPLIIKCRSK